MMIVDVDDQTGDVTFGERDGLEVMRPYHEDNSAISWKSSSLRMWLNNTFFNTLPTNIKNNIKEKTATYQIAPSTNKSTPEEATDNIWIPTVTNVNLNDTSVGNYETGHKILEYYKTAEGRKKPGHTKYINVDGKEGTQGETYLWGLSTPRTMSGSSHTRCCIHGTTGALFTLMQTQYSIIVPHFIIGGT